MYFIVIFYFYKVVSFLHILCLITLMSIHTCFIFLKWCMVIYCYIDILWRNLTMPLWLDIQVVSWLYVSTIFKLRSNMLAPKVGYMIDLRTGAGVSSEPLGNCGCLSILVRVFFYTVLFSFDEPECLTAVVGADWKEACVVLTYWKDFLISASNPAPGHLGVFLYKQLFWRTFSLGGSFFFLIFKNSLHIRKIALW